MTNVTMPFLHKFLILFQLLHGESPKVKDTVILPINICFYLHILYISCFVGEFSFKKEFIYFSDQINKSKNFKN